MHLGGIQEFSPQQEDLGVIWKVSWDFQPLVILEIKDSKSFECIRYVILQKILIILNCSYQNIKSRHFDIVISVFINELNTKS